MSLRYRLFARLVTSVAGLLIALPAWSLPAGLVDLNLANQAELEMVKGVGPQLSERILHERADRPFASWEDFIARLKGLGPSHAARLSAAGLRVGEQPYAGKAPGREPAK